MSDTYFEEEGTDRDRVRVFVTGSCEGPRRPPRSPGGAPRGRVRRLVGAGPRRRRARSRAATSTSSSTGRAASRRPLELAAIREYTRAPVILVASIESAALLEEALEADVADVLLLPQLPENVVFALKKVSHPAGARRRRPAGRGS